MIASLILISIAVSFFVTLFTIPVWIKKAKGVGLVGNDMNKLKKIEVVESGGISVLLGFILGVLLYIAYRTFLLGATNGALIGSLATLCSLLIIGFIGFADDILGWKIGLTRKVRLFLLIFAAIPLMVINAGESVISLPFLGIMNVGLLYPLILIPLAIVGASATFNFLAGINGLEAGQGILILSALAITTYFTGNSWLTIILLCMVASLLAFLLFNFYPARVFPGDILTYSVGGLIAIAAILGNIEKIALFFFIPYILEVGLKVRGKLKKESFGKPTQDGTLDLRYPKIYGVVHLAIVALKKLGIRSTEKNVAYLIWAFQLLIIIAGFIIFRNGIF